MGGIWGWGYPGLGVRDTPEMGVGGIWGWKAGVGEVGWEHEIPGAGRGVQGMKLDTGHPGAGGGDPAAGSARGSIPW